MPIQGQSSFGIVDGSADFMLSYPISFSLLALYHVKVLLEKLNVIKVELNQ